MARTTTAAMASGSQLRSAGAVRTDELRASAHERIVHRLRAKNAPCEPMGRERPARLPSKSADAGREHCESLFKLARLLASRNALARLKGHETLATRSKRAPTFAQLLRKAWKAGQGCTPPLTVVHRPRQAATNRPSTSRSDRGMRLPESHAHGHAVVLVSLWVF